LVTVRVSREIQEFQEFPVSPHLPSVEPPGSNASDQRRWLKAGKKGRRTVGTGAVGAGDDHILNSSGEEADRLRT